MTETVSHALIAIDENSRILSANPATERVFGYASHELVGQELTMLMPDYLRHAHRAAVQRYLDTGEKQRPWQGWELPGLHKDGHEIPLEVSFGEYAHDGKHVFVGSIRDVAERKRAEKEHAQLTGIGAKLRRLRQPLSRNTDYRIRRQSRTRTPNPVPSPWRKATCTSRNRGLTRRFLTSS